MKSINDLSRKFYVIYPNWMGIIEIHSGSCTVMNVLVHLYFWEKYRGLDNSQKIEKYFVISQGKGRSGEGFYYFIGCLFFTK